MEIGRRGRRRGKWRNRDGHGRLRRGFDRYGLSGRLWLTAGRTELRARPGERSAPMEARRKGQFHKLLCYNEAPSHVDSSSLSERTEKSASQWDYSLYCIMLSDALDTVLSDRLLVPRNARAPVARTP